MFTSGKGPIQIYFGPFFIAGERGTVNLWSQSPGKQRNGVALSQAGSLTPAAVPLIFMPRKMQSQARLAVSHEKSRQRLRRSIIEKNTLLRGSLERRGDLKCADLQ
jgi:hypothetical protein